MLKNKFKLMTLALGMGISMGVYAGSESSSAICDSLCRDCIAFDIVSACDQWVSAGCWRYNSCLYQ